MWESNWRKEKRNKKWYRVLARKIIDVIMPIGNKRIFKKMCPGGRHAYFHTKYGLIRKPIY